MTRQHFSGFYLIDEILPSKWAQVPNSIPNEDLSDLPHTLKMGADRFKDAMQFQQAIGHHREVGHHVVLAQKAA